MALSDKSSPAKKHAEPPPRRGSLGALPIGNQAQEHPGGVNQGMETVSKCHQDILMIFFRYSLTIVFQSAYVFERLYPLKKTSDPHPNARRQDILLRKLPEDLAMTYKVLQEPKDVRPEPVRVIVLKNTEDFGKRGQIVTVDDPRQARDDLLLPGLAVHASEENLQKYRDIAISEDKFRFSSQDVKDVSSNFKHLNLNGFFGGRRPP